MMKKWVTKAHISGEGMGEMTAGGAAVRVEGVGLLEEEVGTDEEEEGVNVW